MKSIKLQTGLSLIEIQVALVIGLILVAGAAQLFISNQQTYRTENALAELQQTGRFIVEKMAKDIRLAGFTGCSTQSIDQPPAINLEPVSAPLPLTNLGGAATSTLIGLAVVDGSNIASAKPSYPLINHPSFNPSANTDLITVQRAHQCGAGIVNLVTQGTGSIPIHSPNNCNIKANYPMLITDCEQAEIFQNRDDTNDPNPGPENLTSIDPLSQTYGDWAQPTAFVYRFMSDTYYIAPSANDPTISSLWKITWAPGNTDGVLDANDFQATEFAQNVVDLQILYGVDTDDNNIPDVYQTADVLTDAENIITVQISILLQSSDDNITTSAQPFQFNGQNVNTANDRRLRTVYTTTVTIKNRLTATI